MNSANESLIVRQRCREWIPLTTQQLRLRHLYQILAYNVVTDKHGSLYYTLHLTSMSAPFYTSEKINNTNPRWCELNFTNLAHLSVTAFVLRIWQNQQQQDKDIILTTWGINLSGLVYLGNKLTDLQPNLFNENSVILQLHGGYFSSLKCMRTETLNNLSKRKGVICKNDCYKISKYTCQRFSTNEIKKSYNIEKLRKLHTLQIRIRNRSLDVQMLREEITSKCALCRNSTDETATTSRSEPEKDSNIRYAPQLLTMNSLNKLLQEKPTRLQMQEIVKVRKEIEIFRFKTKLLLQEKDRKNANIRQLKQSYIQLLDKNEETEHILLENYRQLSKDIEKLKEKKQEQILHHETLLNLSSQLHHRRRQLVSQLLMIYPIVEMQKNKYYINNVYLPDADLLADYTDNGLSVALGYVAHVLTMCASFLQVPLRYPVYHMGSRSCIVDNVSPHLADRDREFPLYTKSKDRMQFVIAVFLLNKNIAQLRYLYGLNTIELKLTLQNLLTFLQGKDYKSKSCHSLPVEELGKEATNGTCTHIKTHRENDEHDKSSGETSVYNSVLNVSSVNFSFKEEQQYNTSFTPIKRRVKPKQSETGPGLSEILAVPEAYLTKQITTNTFKSYMSNRKLLKKTLKSDDTQFRSKQQMHQHSLASSSSNYGSTKSNGHPKNFHGTESFAGHIEEGTDVTCSPNCSTSNTFKRKSRSVGSYTDEESLLDYKHNCEVGSDPLINISSCTNNSNLTTHFREFKNADVDPKEYLEKWLDNGPALVASEETLYPEEILGVEEVNPHNPAAPQLTLRTDALMNTTSFNLVKPKL